MCRHKIAEYTEEKKYPIKSTTLYWGRLDENMHKMVQHTIVDKNCLHPRSPNTTIKSNIV